MNKRSLLLRKTRLGALIISLMLAGACGKLEEMADLSQQMRNTTDEMNQRTALLQRQQRQGVATQTRSQALERILRLDDSLELKAKDAAIYFQSFEFQLWENILGDDERIRLDLLTHAAREFFVTFRGILAGSRPDPDPLSSDARMATLFALSATVDQMNDLQLAASQKPQSGFDPITFLAMVENAISSQGALLDDPTRNVPDYVRQILVYEKEAQYLIELRAHIRAAMALDLLAQRPERDFWKRLELLLSAIGWGKSWEADLGSMNSAMLDEASRFLEDALRSWRLLKSHDPGAKLHSSLSRLIQKIKLKEDPRADARKRESTEKLKKRIKCFVDGTQA